VTSPLVGQSLDEQIRRTEERLQAARDREGVLTADVERYGQTVRELEGRLAPLRERSSRLDSELAGLRGRLAVLDDRLAEERARLARARAALAARQEVMARRLREIYVRGEPDLILILMESGSLTAAVETVDVLEGIATRDAAIADSVSRFADETRRRRDEISAIREEVAASEARVEIAAAEARAARTEIEQRQAQLEGALAGRRELLARAAGSRRELEEEARGLQARSAELAATIRAAQEPSVSAAAPSTPSPASSPASSSGFIWPVRGTLTSAFGPRWGRMHEGIDIAGPSGTPIAAAAAGKVIVAGWSGGYGNLVVIDHGGGMSTAYAHNSTIAVSVGQQVGQGSVIAGMGTTGNSTGVHSHFEVRVNGSAVDPMGYL
jgi:murein DD-endopeptidase MepM/ murein hydrolase activator NlpD